MGSCQQLLQCQGQGLMCVISAGDSILKKLRDSWSASIHACPPFAGAKATGSERAQWPGLPDSSCSDGPVASTEEAAGTTNLNQIGIIYCRRVICYPSHFMTPWVHFFWSGVMDGRLSIRLSRFWMVTHKTIIKLKRHEITTYQLFMWSSHSHSPPERV